MRDLRGRGDIAVGESEPGGAGDRLMKVVFCLAPAAGGPFDAGEQLARECSTGLLLSALFSLGDGGDWISRGDRGGGRVCESLGQRAGVERVLTGERAQLLFCGGC